MTGTIPFPKLTREAVTGHRSQQQAGVAAAITLAGPGYPPAHTAGPAAATRRRRAWGRAAAAFLARVLPWPLIAVIAVQNALSIRLTWSATAVGDEGICLLFGHLLHRGRGRRRRCCGRHRTRRADGGGRR